MTERGRDRVLADRSHLVIGSSSLDWDGQCLTIDLDETTAPLPARVRGRVRLFADTLQEHAHALHPNGLHSWRPIAPQARVEVRLDQPGLSWNGTGYLDCNAGHEPLEDGFRRWDWARVHVGRDTMLFYDATLGNTAARSLALRVGPDGGVEHLVPPPRQKLRRTLWGIERNLQAPAGDARIVRTLEDGPFYARSLVSMTLAGQQACAMHESLSLDRFRTNWVKALLPFRMPRALW